MIALKSKRSGHSLFEMMVTMSVLGFIFAAMGSMIWISSRSAVNIHQQVISQTSTAKAHEKATALLRNAVGYKRIQADIDSGEVDITRVYSEVPLTPTSTQTHTLALKRVGGFLELRYYTSKINSWDPDGTVASSVTAVPYFKARVADFHMTYASEYRLLLRTSFVYKGFALVFANPGLPQHGDFITEAIAKNHFMDTGVDNYAQADDPTLTPASL